jgi:catechol 2,3-dioxygenase-like lactoylglutathione lyase family enzyme
MITNLSHTTVYVLDQESAKAFYTEKLGFTLRFDFVMGDGPGGGFRWLTVSPPAQPDIQFILADCGMGHAPGHADTIRELVAKGGDGQRGPRHGRLPRHLPGVVRSWGRLPHRTRRAALRHRGDLP